MNFYLILLSYIRVWTFLLLHLSVKEVLFYVGEKVLVEHWVEIIMSHYSQAVVLKPSCCCQLQNDLQHLPVLWRWYSWVKLAKSELAKYAFPNMAYLVFWKVLCQNWPRLKSITLPGGLVATCSCNCLKIKSPLVFHTRSSLKLDFDPVLFDGLWTWNFTSMQGKHSSLLHETWLTPAVRRRWRLTDLCALLALRLVFI